MALFNEFFSISTKVQMCVKSMTKYHTQEIGYCFITGNELDQLRMLDMFAVRCAE